MKMVNWLSRWSLWLGLLSAVSLPAWAAAPAVGDAAPVFRLVDQHGVWRELAEFRGRWLVLYFYPKDQTQGCTEQACSFRDDFVKLKLLGAEVVGISLDSRESHAAFAQKYLLPFPLLSDPDGETAARYGALRNLLVLKFAKRHTFLIDPNGKIARRYTDLDTATYASRIVKDLSALTRKPAH